jgi:SAM-dependent methyltransferase
VPDAHFAVPRLASIYDDLDPDRSDLDHYESIVDEFNARSILDIGCGTGTFACRMALRGLEVTGVDPAEASLAVARRKPGGDRVRWVLGTADDLLVDAVDMAVMTGNVAQVFVEEATWHGALRSVARSLKSNGRFVFESRDPTRRAWDEWNRSGTLTATNVPGVGEVEHWIDLVDLSLPLVSFRTTFRFAADGAVLTSDSTLRFRGKDEIVASLVTVGLIADEVRDAPDRPGREFVFISRCP